MNNELPADDQPITLFLYGGGSRFPAFVGAIAAIEEKGLKIGMVCGASTGSVVAALFAAGVSPREMLAKTLECGFDGFKDFSIGSLLFDGGLYRGDALETWLDNLFQGRTFKDDFPIPLQVVATDIRSRTPVIFSRETTPDVKVATAVRFSLGLPLLFGYRRFFHEGRQHILVDGSLTANVVEDDLRQRGRTLVLRTISKRSRHTLAEEKFTLFRYARALLEILIHAMEKEFIKGERWRDSILIYCGAIASTKYPLTPAEIRHLFDQGHQQAGRYLDYKWGGMGARGDGRR
ncbi:MAG TPA: patatin-like phospholipase family protein [Geobacteraceae bacterium]